MFTKTALMTLFAAATLLLGCTDSVDNSCRVTSDCEGQNVCTNNVCVSDPDLKAVIAFDESSTLDERADNLSYPEPGSSEPMVHTHQQSDANPATKLGAKETCPIVYKYAHLFSEEVLVQEETPNPISYSYSLSDNLPLEGSEIQYQLREESEQSENQAWIKAPGDFENSDKLRFEGTIKLLEDKFKAPPKHGGRYTFAIRVEDSDGNLSVEERCFELAVLPIPLRVGEIELGSLTRRNFWDDSTLVDVLNGEASEEMVTLTVENFTRLPAPVAISPHFGINHCAKGYVHSSYPIATNTSSRASCMYASRYEDGPCALEPAIESEEVLSIFCEDIAETEMRTVQIENQAPPLVCEHCEGADGMMVPAKSSADAASGALISSIRLNKASGLSPYSPINAPERRFERFSLENFELTGATLGTYDMCTDVENSAQFYSCREVTTFQIYRATTMFSLSNNLIGFSTHTFDSDSKPDSDMSTQMAPFTWSGEISGQLPPLFPELR